jgi:hypothetical protein
MKKSLMIGFLFAFIFCSVFVLADSVGPKVENISAIRTGELARVSFNVLDSDNLDFCLVSIKGLHETAPLKQNISFYNNTYNSSPSFIFEGLKPSLYLGVIYCNNTKNISSGLIRFNFSVENSSIVSAPKKINDSQTDKKDTSPPKENSSYLLKRYVVGAVLIGGFFLIFVGGLYLVWKKKLMLKN